MRYQYDDQNIFAKILRGEIPNKTVAETEHSLAFHDIAPLSPAHVLIIPKGAYVTFDQFTSQASDIEILDFFRLSAQLCADLSLCPDGDDRGYRVISNAGRHGGQDVPHFHLHLLGGEPIGRMVAKSKS